MKENASLSMLFWGLFFSFFSINISNLNLFTTLLGALLLVAALWRLRPNGRWLRWAFIASLLSAFAQAAQLVLTFLKQKGGINFQSTNGITVTVNFPLTASLGALQTLGWTALFIFLFLGLSELAKQMGDSMLAGRLFRCFWLLPGTLVLFAAAIFFPPILMLLILPFIAVFIYILVQVSRFSRLAAESSVLQEGVAGTGFHCAMGGTILLIFLLCFGALYLSAAPPMPIRPYLRQSGGAQATTVRQKLKRAGMPQNVLNDLPDSEVLRCKTMVSLKKYTYYTGVGNDGGDLRISEYFVSLKDEMAHLLIYYKWNTLPRHHYCEYLWVNMNNQVIKPSQTKPPEYVSLFDKKTAHGFKTFCTDLINSMDGQNAPPHMEYRLWDADAVRQRGFLSFDAHIQGKSNHTIETDVNCAHQVNIFTLNNISPFAGQPNASIPMINQFSDMSSYAQSQDINVYPNFSVEFDIHYKPQT